ncbi:hypothetical protein ACJ7K1_04895 [Paenibacillus elgii]
MNRNWKKLMVAFVVSAALVYQPGFVSALEAQQIPAQAESYAIAKSLRVEVKSVLNEKTSSGVQLGAVIRLHNDSDTIVRVPDHELRLKTASGLEYILQSSRSNLRSIEPKSKEELSYMKVVERKTAVQPTELLLVDVDLNVYPKKEKVLASIPVASMLWNGSYSEMNPSAVKNWGESFRIPTLDSQLLYTPVGYTKNHTPQGIEMLIKLLVENPSEQREMIPAFSLDAKTAQQIYHGNRVEKEAIALEPGKKRFIYYAIPTDMDFNGEISSLNVLASEQFVAQGEQETAGAVHFSVGKLAIRFPNQGTREVESTPQEYRMNTPIAFDKWNNYIDPSLEVSVTDLYVGENSGDGYKTAIAKFKLTNKGERSIPIPAFGAELSGKEGSRYSGSRQNYTLKELMPGTGSVVSYVFVFPTSETTELFNLRLLDDKSAAPHQTSIASVVVKPSNKSDSSKLSFYPYTVHLKDWTLFPYVTQTPTNAMAYTYKLVLNLDVMKDAQMIADPSFSKMKVELEDGLGRTIGYQYYSFVGPNRLVSGRQKLTVDGLPGADQMETNLTVKIYEVIETASGEVKRLVTALKSY